MPFFSSWSGLLPFFLLFLWIGWALLMAHMNGCNQVFSKRYSPSNVCTRDNTTYYQFAKAAFPCSFGLEDIIIMSFNLPCSLCPLWLCICLLGRSAFGMYIGFESVIPKKLSDLLSQFFSRVWFWIVFAFFFVTV